ncbi:hypothetical protein [Brachybacterium hainanense]|uniref:Uncharacterized protein n=1 Tax=Brachybacterium hainanense TaxID=1541174 RepID=A0ABV6R7L2_9MICO
MDVDPAFDARRAAYDAATAASGRAMTAFEEHLAAAVVALAISHEQLNLKLDALLAAVPASDEPDQRP